MTNANIQYLDIEEPDIYRDRQLYLLILLPLCMIGITLLYIEYNLCILLKNSDMIVLIK